MKEERKGEKKQPERGGKKGLFSTSVAPPLTSFFVAAWEEERKGWKEGHVQRGRGGVGPNQEKGGSGGWGGGEVRVEV